MKSQDPLRFAERIRALCIDAATTAYEDAGVQGLCAEGRFEAAIDAIRQLNLSELRAAGADVPQDRGG